ncbi:MAG: diacylglycerol kinase [Burkholderiaceae bacterium]
MQADKPHSPPLSSFKSKGGLARIKNALTYSLRGLVAAYQQEAAFRQELLLCLVGITVALFLPVALLERVALIGVLLLILIVELLNSALETVVDYISTEHHPLAGRAKDIGSAAVFLTLVLAGLTWLAVVGPLVWKWVEV